MASPSRTPVKIPSGAIPISGDTVRRLRSLKGWTQEQLAEEAHLSTGTISNMENGHPCYYATIAFVAEALDTPIENLLDSTPSSLVADTIDSANKITETVLVVKGDPSSFDADDSLRLLITGIESIIKARYPLAVVRIDFSSVLVTIQLLDTDLLALVRAFVAGELTTLGVVSLRLPQTDLIQRIFKAEPDPQDKSMGFFESLFFHWSTAAAGSSAPYGAKTDMQKLREQIDASGKLIISPQVDGTIVLSRQD